ncbi:hypothetical protein GF412_02085 [Candidatus Micrarchaeota archaeon]|nr:hypothetical protein [Candidatus Micrarchaeota archaeon]MBD3417751.1 hypothetical protein [Candidatus Micrarchaeota archaeon]
MGKKRTIQRNRISRPILLSPKQEGSCPFGSSCEKNCILEKELLPTESAKRNLKKRIGETLEKFDSIQEPPFSTEEYEKKESLAVELIFMLEGIAIPDREGKIEHSSCGRREGTRQKMQAMGNQELKELVGGISLEPDMAGTYQALSKTSPPSGIHPTFALLLARISALQLPGSSQALEMLMEDGGTRGAEIISWMAAEPTIDEESRREYVAALQRMASCASFDGGEAEISKGDYRLAAALSRFLPMENITMHFPGTYDADIYRVDGLPGIPEKPELGRLRAMVMLSTEELLVALFGISQRMYELCSVPYEDFPEYSVRVQKMQKTLEKGIGFIAGKGAENKEMLATVCSRIEARMEGSEEEPMLEEQGFVRYLTEKMLEEGKLDNDAAESLLMMLSPEEPEMQEQLVMLNFHPAHQLHAQ